MKTIVAIVLVQYLHLFPSVATGQSKQVGSFGPFNIAIGEDTVLYRFPYHFDIPTEYPCVHESCRLDLGWVRSGHGNDNFVHGDALLYHDATLFPTQPGVFTDTVFALYSFRSDTCRLACSITDGSDRPYFSVQWSAHWDSLVKIRPKYDSIVFRFQAQNLYYPPSSRVYLFNNIDDSVRFSDWQIETSPPLSISVALKFDTITRTEYVSKPLEHLISATAMYSTTEPTTPDQRIYHGFLRERVQSSRIDSIFRMPLTIVFEADPTSRVAQSVTSPDVFSVRANPSAAHELIVQTDLESAQEGRIEIFDLLGRSVALVTDGMIPPGQTVYSAPSLHSGTYFVRMQWASNVETKRIVFE